MREQHVSQLAPGEQSPLQAAFEYSDGMGSVVVKKVQAEPEADGQPLRWVANGKTILNNKGKPVKQYEPYFSPPEWAIGSRNRAKKASRRSFTTMPSVARCAPKCRTAASAGSSSRPGMCARSTRTIRCKRASGTDRTGSTTADRQSSRRFSHAGGTSAPRVGRANMPTRPRSRFSTASGARSSPSPTTGSRNAAGELKDEKYLTFTKLDAEGKPLWIRDARKNLVMQYITPPVPNNQAADPVTGFAPCYDIAGNLLFQHSMDAGDRWMLNDAAGKPMLAWDSRGHTFRTDYDALHRPVGSFVKGADPLDANRMIQFEKVIYGDTPGNGLTDAPAKIRPEN